MTERNQTQALPAVGQRWVHRDDSNCVRVLAEGPKYDDTVPSGRSNEWWWCSDGSGVFTEELRRFYTQEPRKQSRDD